MKRTDQAGIVSIVAAILLVSGVLVVILLTTGVIRTRSIDTARTSDSEAAFALAESGLERAQAVISNAVTSAATSDSTCSGFLTDGPFSVGRGTFSYSAANSLPPSCGTTTYCEKCQLTAKGVVGSTERDLSLEVEYGQQDGVTGRGTVVKMALKNTFSTDAIALFNLAWRRQGQGGNASSTLTTCATCTLMWNLNSSSGMHSAGGMGTSVPIAANTYSQIVTQTLDYSRDYTEVGGLFPGVSSAPTKLAAYWSDGSEGAGATYTTFANNGTTTTGNLRAGAATSSQASCSSASNPPGNNGDYQGCTSWCYGGDTLIMGLSARSTTVADKTSAASFDTNGSNAPMSFLVHYPNTDGSTANASGEEYSEIYYLYNPPYSSTSDPANSSFSGAGATSYTAAVIGAAGAALSFPNSSKIGNGSTSGTFTSVTGYQACVGDAIVDGHLQAGTTITSLKQHVGGAAVTCVSAGTVNIDIVVSQNSTGNVTSPTVTSTSLHTSATTANLAAGSATVVAGGTINIASGPDGSGVYTLSTAATVASGYIVQGSGSSTTIKVASASDLPSTITWTDASTPPATHNTFVRVYSLASNGTGVLAANTTITAIDTVNKTFTISSAPSTPLVGATVCAGTCALFNTPGSTSAVTAFSISPSAGTKQWSIGFMCMSGVDPTKIQKVTSTAIKSRNWSEAVQ
jgi:Tfp pilus assembly protein PilX